MLKANLAPDLVRALRELRPPRYKSGASPARNCAPLDPPLTCLLLLFRANIGNPGQEIDGNSMQPMINAGIIPVFIDLLKLGHEPTTVKIVELSGLLLLPAYPGQIVPGGVGLLRALAQLLDAVPPVTSRVAAVTLYNVGAAHPELTVDCRTWGIEDTVQQLTLHADRATAVAASRVNKLLFDHDGADVSSVSFLPTLPIGPHLFLDCQGFTCCLSPAKP